jgi:23S rRNA (guanosine2251-2'-O)-methyltransferase
MKKSDARGAKTERGYELCGVNPVLEALRAGRRTIDEILIAEGARHQRLREIVELARAKNVPVHHAPRVKLDREASQSHHQGIIARVATARYADADDLLDSINILVDGAKASLFLVLDGIEDPRNLGAILRTAECAGVDGVFVPERRAVGLTDTVAKAAAGALEHVPVARVGNLSRLIEQLKERNVWIVGADATAATPYSEWDWALPTAIVFGGEGQGLHRLVRERCDKLVRIPLFGRVESLNVSVAAGIVLYEALRQRGIGKTNAEQ